MLGEETSIWYLKFLWGPSPELLDLMCVSGLQKDVMSGLLIPPVHQLPCKHWVAGEGQYCSTLVSQLAAGLL